MKTLLPLLASLILAASPAFAAADKQTEAPAAGAKQLSSSQQRMVDCNKEAGERKGEERKAFMSACLKKK